MVTPHFTVVTNFVLAAIPFVLATYLFLFSRHRSILWWLLLIVCIAFLPNSAYVVTDIIHFIAATKDPSYSFTKVWLVLLPAYIIFISINFEFYVISIRMMQNSLRIHRSAKLAVWFIPFIHLLCAIGVYLGRVQRLESYDIIQNPLVVFKDLYYDLTHEKPVLIILGFTLLFYGLYLVFNQLNQKIGLNTWLDNKMQTKQ
ncbi:DUF1361 domain-containing protein [Saccharobesus litoralis]|uniref:DUF1361 domain-containing protein n=1 Tax=Saccharobesus litoralis TaxID=2172099 RepID=A0A2S0VQE6_9ALTE|nr:DUF1361 domain-containing protein [Saccharobesus litoralis]AWB66437.1 DUF1361 domain-containing protein [Saccharobesus litoralis]